ncbi:YfjL-like protein [Cohnella cholangitidis]|uniref:YfjL-like N-terminal domain-containing protein n=1 Tax=Cohnella cholangitidis TaxID=2598458 RepID=A0A7G5BZN5_9BACL|nr:hypothetical protein [Cohnella cholangitidis]QMV42419.1 hypothetical protein FPL14_15350 [Cohnella cholangitidis]
MSKKIAYLILSTVAALILIAICYVYTEMNGYPWKHAQVKQEAVLYMKNKYNMDVKASGSSYNFKFKYYTAKVYDANDVEKSIISVEKQRHYDDQNLYKGYRLEDNYSEVYWKKRAEQETREAYPNLFASSRIERAAIDTVYSTFSLEEGLSSESDESDIVIPSEPDYNYTLDIDLASEEITDAFLLELLPVIQDVAKGERRIDFFITGREIPSGTPDRAGTTRLLSLTFEQLGTVGSIDDLRKEISEI